jgi:mRNA interferase MazF
VKVSRGDVVEVVLDPTIGSEIKKSRRCVIVQRDAANRTSPILIICPLTDAGDSLGNLLNVLIPKGIGGTTKASLVVCNQIRAVDRVRIRRQYGALPTDIMLRVDKGLRAILDL